MLSILEAFGIKDQNILKDKDQLANFLQLDLSTLNNSDNNTKALISTVLTLVDVIYSIQKQLKENTLNNVRQKSLKKFKKSKSVQSNGDTYKIQKKFGINKGYNDEDGDEDSNDDSDNDSDNGSDNDSGSESEGYGDSLDQRQDNLSSSSSSLSLSSSSSSSSLSSSSSSSSSLSSSSNEANHDENETEGASDYDTKKLVTTHKNDSKIIEEDDSSDGFEYDDVIMNSGDNEEDLNNNLDPIFDKITTSDKTLHPIPTNFSYNYKPQQINTLKIPANISANQTTGRTITLVNWTDVPLSQIAMKYNISKSVIGPTLQVLRDFEKKNTKELQERIKKSKIANEERRLKLDKLNNEPDSLNNESINDDNNIPNIALTKPKKSFKSNSRRNSPIVLTKEKDKKNVSDSHKIRLRLRNKRKNGHDVNSKGSDESSSESVYDPNYRSDNENNNGITTSINEDIREVKLFKGKEVNNSSINKRNNSSVDGNNNNSTNNYNINAKRVKFNDKVNQQNLDNASNEKDQQLSNSLFKFLQTSINENNENDVLIPSIEKEETKLMINSKQNSQIKKNNEYNVEVEEANKSDDQVPSFAYSLTSNGQYQCKSSGCNANPFNQYIQLYKHKSIEHPRELPT